MAMETWQHMCILSVACVRAGFWLEKFQ